MEKRFCEKFAKVPQSQICLFSPVLRTISIQSDQSFHKLSCLQGSDLWEIESNSPEWLIASLISKEFELSFLTTTNNVLGIYPS
jgi:hypothetical protein